jgi:hypothetical protein
MTFDFVSGLDQSAAFSRGRGRAAAIMADTHLKKKH